MSQGVFNLNLRGRYGNTLFQTAFAIAYCKRHDLELRIEGNWVGEEIFGMKLGRFKERFHYRKRNEDTLDPNGEADVEFTGYCQNQNSLIYTRSEVREWFRITQPYRGRLSPHLNHLPQVMWHVRFGDFQGYGYPTIGLPAFVKATREMVANPKGCGVTSDELPSRDPIIPDNMDFLPDFYRLMHAQILFRANSSFSWWAATLGDHQAVYAPVIEGLDGGGEHHDVPFVSGNWPRLSMHDFCTDLHLK